MARSWTRWDALEKRVKRRCGGDADMTEINKMFGWEE